jgi:hypothetical protein
MTEGTISTFPWGAGNELIRSFDMLRRRAVARFTRNPLMIGFLVKFIDLLVAVDTRHVTGIIYLLVYHFVNSISSVMPISPE